MNNFTWIKEPLGVDEKYELIRNASVTKIQVMLVFTTTLFVHTKHYSCLYIQKTVAITYRTDLY